MEDTAAQRKKPTCRTSFHCRRRILERHQKHSFQICIDFKFGNANIRKKFQKRNLHDGSERPGQRDDGESQKTHVGTGDDKMIVDQIDEIPGPSGVESKKTNRNAPGYTTNTVGDKRKEKNTPQKQGSKPGYKITRIQAEKNPNKGNRKTNVGEELNPHASGEQQQLQQQ